MKPQLIIPEQEQATILGLRADLVVCDDIEVEGLYFDELSPIDSAELDAMCDLSKLLQHQAI